jgi:hypothetical protein
LDFRILDLIATIIGFCTPPHARGRGHPPTETIRVLATLRQFLREGTPWRSLHATAAQASGSTLRRYLEQWARSGLLAQVHAVLVAMLRGDPTLILDSCSVRAKRGGDLTGPNPTDRGKRGTKYHIATTGDGVPVACTATAANVNDTVVFERLFLAAFAVLARIRTVFADKSLPSRRRGATTPSTIASCAGSSGPNPTSTSAASRTDPVWASGAGRSSAPTPGCWRTSASPSAMTGSASSSSPCSRPHASSWLQDASAANCENRFLADLGNALAGA